MKFNNKKFLHATLPAAKAGIGVSSDHLLASTAFLASAVRAKNARSKDFALQQVIGIYNGTFKRSFELKIEMLPENENQKTWI